MRRLLATTTAAFSLLLLLLLISDFALLSTARFLLLDCWVSTSQSSSLQDHNHLVLELLHKKVPFLLHKDFFDSFLQPHTLGDIVCVRESDGRKFWKIKYRKGLKSKRYYKKKKFHPKSQLISLTNDFHHFGNL